MRRFGWKRAATGLAACALVLALLGGCGKDKAREVVLHGPDEGIARERIALSFFGFKADAMNLTAIEAAMQSFMAAHDNIDINYESLKGGAYWEAFDKRDAAGCLDDVFMMHHDHLIPMSAAGKLADLSALPGLENYTNEARGQFTDPDGAVYFLPTQISTYNLYINYDLLKANGQEVPENWAQFQQVCDHFVGQGVVPIVANNRNSLSSLIISKGLFELYQRPEEELTAALRRFNQDPGALAEALKPGVEQVADMLARGWFDPAEVLVTEQTSDDLERFAQGDRPFMISGGWASIRLKALEPDFTYGVHPYPILDDGSVMSVQVDTCISVNAKSEHLAEAKEFVAHLIEPDVMWAYCDTQASYSPLKDNRPLSEETMTPSIDYLTNGRVVFRSEYRLDLPVETAAQSCARVLLEGGSVTEAMERLASELQK